MTFPILFCFSLVTTILITFSNNAEKEVLISGFGIINLPNQIKTKHVIKERTNLATPRYLETPLEKPLLWRRREAKYSSFVPLCISSNSFAYVSTCDESIFFIIKTKSNKHMHQSINQWIKIFFLPESSRWCRDPSTWEQLDRTCVLLLPRCHMLLQSRVRAVEIHSFILLTKSTLFYFKKIKY